MIFGQYFKNYDKQDHLAVVPALLAKIAETILKKSPNITNK